MEVQLQSWVTVLLGLIAVAIVAVLRHMRRNDDYWAKRGVHYMPRMSIFAMAKMFYSMPMHEMVLDAHKKYGKVYGRFENTTPHAAVGDPDLLRDILVKDFHIFSSRRMLKFNDPVIDNMLSILNGEDWKRVRTVMTPAFTSRKMRQMVNIINSCSETVLKTLKEHSDKSIAMDCKKVFGAFTMDVIASSAFATKIDSHNDPYNPFVTHARNAFTNQAGLKTLLFFILPPKLWKIFRIDLFDRPAMEFFRSVTLQVIDERRKKGIKGNDFLQLLMDTSDEIIEGEEKVAGFETIDEEDHFGRIDNNSNITYTSKKLSQNEIIAQCVLFFVVGYETSASTLSFSAYNLALNQDCQEKLIDEVDRAFEKHSEMTYEVVRDMQYMDSVISETLRLFPPLLVGERTAVEDYELGKTGVTVEKGMTVQYPIYAMHHDPEYFSDPEKFDPERFMGSNREKFHPYAYLPFGAGPRNCLGMRFALMEIKLCLANILRQYRFRVAPETKIPLEFVFSSGFLSTRELPLVIEKRTDIRV